MKVTVNRAAREKRELTLREITDAIEKNGLPQTKGMYWDSKHADWNAANRTWTYEVGAACAIGQAAINLGVDYDALTDFLLDIGRGNKTLYHYITGKNDGVDGLSLKEIADKIRKNHKAKLDTPQTIYYYPVDAED